MYLSQQYSYDSLYHMQGDYNNTNINAGMSTSTALDEAYCNPKNQKKK